MIAIVVMLTVAAIDIREAARLAVANHPRARACEHQVESARGTGDEARAALLPSLNLGLQLNRGTGNVVPGSAFSMAGVPNFSGPPRGDVFDSGVWTTVASLSSSFDLIGLVRRMRNLDAALANEQGEEAQRDLCQLDVAYDAQSAFLDVVSLQAALAALAADRARADALLQRTRALVEAHIRANAELSQAEAELAAVEARFAAVSRDLRIARVRLAEALGTDTAPEVDTDLPRISARQQAQHPRVRLEHQRVSAAELSARATRVAYYPRVELAAALWARGSGYPADATGARLGPSSSGLAPDVANWLAGVVVNWDLLDLPEARARVARANAETAIRRSTRDASLIALRSQIDSAQAAVEGAAVVLERTGPAVDAARVALSQSEARYAGGLATTLDLARVRQLLVDAELAHVGATVALSRAEVARARAVGDLSAMTEQP